MEKVKQFVTNDGTISGILKVDGELNSDILPSDDVKPGYQTTEFWMALATSVISFLISSGVFKSDSSISQILSLLAGLLATLGYTASRTIAKSNSVKMKVAKFNAFKKV